DLSHVYFVSEEALATGATYGEPNLYLDDEGALTLVRTLPVADGTNHAYFSPSVASPLPIMRATRVSPDGRYFAFQSTGNLTGYDNTDAVTGESDLEVYLYDAEAGKLTCVSCNPSGARPEGQPQLPPYAPPRVGTTMFRAAAWLPTWETSVYAPNALMANGGRVFFNSFDPLVPQDVNGAQDVYEWEAPGTGRCAEASPTFSAQDEGCVSLISSGESPQKSEFLDASANGRDVFFETSASLLPQDPGLIDVYDAREGGGFPQPFHTAACEGETCQNTPAAPNDPTPGSATYKGPGNVVEKSTRKHKKKRHKKHRRKRRRHARKHKRHGRKHARSHNRRANHNRRAAR
ncbi:MAG TPA: hypothetical protein VE197_12620, partial [Mycobacterium sp.]|nr:hypothetical protein [Mycobacterium sp.]